MNTPNIPALREQIDSAPGGAFLAEAVPTDPSGYVLTVTRYTPEPEQLLRIELPEWDYFRAASAGHRLIEHGFQVLPAAHYEPDRAAGWRPAPDGLSYTAPVYRPTGQADDFANIADPSNPTTTALTLLQNIETLAARCYADGNRESADTMREIGPTFAMKLAGLIAENPAQMLPLVREELDSMLTDMRRQQNGQAPT